jgi:transcriptional regulator with XRE-family HTH domain
LDEVLAKLPRARRAKIGKRTRELMAEEMSLRALRQAMGRTQAKLAADLGVGQDAVSRYEQRADMLLSTLQGYIKAMGGRLSLVAEFPNRRPVRIKTLAEITPAEGSR